MIHFHRRKLYSVDIVLPTIEGREIFLRALLHPFRIRSRLEVLQIEDRRKCLALDDGADGAMVQLSLPEVSEELGRELDRIRVFR